jgi:putative DNA primase/helicase
VDDNEHALAAANEFLDAALTWARAGFAVFPTHGIGADNACTCGKAECASQGKHPRVAAWQEVATTHEPQIERWWRQWPDANIGVIPGSNGCVGVDVDPRNGGDEHLAQLLGGEGLNGTLVVRTGQYGDVRGRHIYFRCEHAREVSKADLGRGVELKAGRAYLLVPPSRHASGVSYEFASGSHDTISDAPAWVRVGLASGSRGTRDAPIDSSRLTHLPLGKRAKDALKSGLPEPDAGQTQRAVAFGIARNMRESGMAYEDVLDGMRTILLHNDSSIDAERPWTEADAEALTNEVFKGPAPDQALYLRKPAAAYDRNDDGNAQLFADENSEYVRWVPEFKSWMAWDEQRWTRIADEYVVQRYLEALRKLQFETGRHDAEVFKWALGARNTGRVRAALTLARSDERILARPDDFDQDPWALNCRNGILDLRSGDLREHDRSAMHSQVTNADFSDNAQSEHWNRVLRESFAGDAEMVAYLQEVFGYALTGDVSDEKIFFFYGQAGAGKTTILDAFGGMLGDYTRVVSSQTLSRSASQSGGVASEDVARLAGARFAVASEFDRGTQLAEARVNSMTGGETIVARHLYQATFEFAPQFKLFFAANHKPQVSASPQSGIWRRLVMIPFSNRVAEVDRDLKKRLRTPQARGAILAWAFEGCQRWIANGGLRPFPGAVRAAFDEYRDESDRFQGFLDERIERAPGSYVTKQAMFDAYLEWAGLEHIRRLASKQALHGILKERGLRDTTREVQRKGKRTSERVWADVALKRGPIHMPGARDA